MSNRIGLLTIHHTTNFGSALQTYGFCILKFVKWDMISALLIIDVRQ